MAEEAEARKGWLVGPRLVVFPGDHTAACQSDWEVDSHPVCSRDCLFLATTSTLEGLDQSPPSPDHDFTLLVHPALPFPEGTSTDFERNDCGCLSAFGTFAAVVSNYPDGCNPSEEQRKANEQSVFELIANKRRRFRWLAASMHGDRALQV